LKNKDYILIQDIFYDTDDFEVALFEIRYPSNSQNFAWEKSLVTLLFTGFKRVILGLISDAERWAVFYWRELKAICSNSSLKNRKCLHRINKKKLI